VIEAGLDIALHCNGKMDEGRAVASATPMLSGASLRRAKAAAATIKAPQPFDVERGERELAAITAELGVA
jgi:beta-N-acetylhexosaminidase